MILTTTGNSATSTILGLKQSDNTDLTLTHPQTLNLLDQYDEVDINSALTSIQLEIIAGNITATDQDLNPIPDVTAVESEPFSTTTVDSLQSQITTLDGEQSTQDAAIALNTAKVSFPEAPADGNDYIRRNSDWEQASAGSGILVVADPDVDVPSPVLDQIVFNTTAQDFEKWDGSAWVQITKDPEEVAADAAGSTLGLQQELLANAGQPGLTVLAVGFTTSGKVQGVSLGDGNVVEVYANGSDFNAGTALYREFMSRGEPICFTGLSNGAIITASEGFYGFSEQVLGSYESPMPLLSYGLSFKSTFFFGFRNSSQQSGTSNESHVRVVNGPLRSSVALKFGNGDVVTGQENIVLEPWEFTSLKTNGNTEYIIESTNPVMACVHAFTNENGDGSSRFYDSRLIMPLTNDGITWPRSGFVSAPFNNTQVDFWVRDGAEGRLNSTAGTGVNPGSPVDFDADIGVGTGAADQDYEPNGATRVKATGLISAYSGADSAGLEASPLMPTKAMSQVVAQPLFIADTGDGGNSGVAIASPFEGTAEIFEWNTTTNTLDLAYTVPLTRSGVTVTTQDDQNHPAAGGVANEAAAYPVQLVGALGPGIIVADVPITVVVQNGESTQGPANTIRSQNGTTTTGIVDDDDETLSLGITPSTIAVEIREDANGILRKRVIDASGVETWEIV